MLFVLSTKIPLGGFYQSSYYFMVYIGTSDLACMKLHCKGFSIYAAAEISMLGRKVCPRLTDPDLRKLAHFETSSTKDRLPL